MHHSGHIRQTHLYCFKKVMPFFIIFFKHIFHNRCISDALVLKKHTAISELSPKSSFNWCLENAPQFLSFMQKKSSNWFFSGGHDIFLGV